MKGFKLFATGVFCIFFSILVYVTMIAFSRPSGSRGMDMGQIQKLRQEVLITESPRP